MTGVEEPDVEAWRARCRADKDVARELDWIDPIPEFWTIQK
jgi:hypothetical protein